MIYGLHQAFVTARIISFVGLPHLFNIPPSVSVTQRLNASPTSKISPKHSKAAFDWVRSPRNSSSAPSSPTALAAASNGPEVAAANCVDQPNVCTVRCLREFMSRLQPDRIPLREPERPGQRLSVREDCLWWRVEARKEAKGAAGDAETHPGTHRSLQEVLQLAQDFVDEARVLRPTTKWIMGEPARPSVLRNVG